MNDFRESEGGSGAFDCLAGGGETGALMRSLDWRQSPVGPVGEWPQSLRTAVRIMLDSRYAMWLGWGPDFTFFYNDSYARMTLGPKHPWALGRPAREVWSEIWDDIGPRAESVIRTGQATWDEGLLLFLERRGTPEETYHTFSYSPVPDDFGGIGGMLCVVTEDTERTIGERRLRTLRELAARTSVEARSVEDACQTAVRTLAENSHDLPFLLVYLNDSEGAARLAGATGLPEGSPAAPPLIELSGAGGRGAGWPLPAVRESGLAQIVTGLEERFGPLQCGPWPEPTRQGVVVPMAKPGQARPAGFVVAGVSPRLILDDGYKGFLDLLAGQIAASIANAQAYDEERRRAEALAELDRAKTAFFSNVSHEFRTPLTLMLGPAEDALADDVEPLPHRQLERVEIIHRNALRLLKLVNTLLDFSRIEAGRVQAVYEPTDLAALTADLASVFRSAVERAGIELVVDCPTLPEPAFVNRDMWEKIVLNLVSNAFKFTLDGRIEVTLRAEGDSIKLRVKDSGTGIPNDELPRLFERFHRVEGAQGRTHEGSGIGLALVQELARLHGGRAEVESTFGDGSSFTVTIPRGRDHLPADRIGGTRSLASTALGATPYVEEAMRWLPGPESASAGPEDHAGLSRQDAPRAIRAGGERLRILLADDNADMREYLTRLLAERYDVTAVSDGMQALAAVKKQPPSLILSDVMMPMLDGFGLLREVRADPATATIPILLLSARAGEEARVEGLERGADDYLTKPFGARELMARVAGHLELARVRRNADRRERELRAEAESILESITDGFLALDRDWRITYINAAAERINGRPRAELLGRDHWDLFPASVGTRLEREFRRAVAEQVSVQFEHFYEPWGRWFETKAYPSRDGGMAVYFRDITGRKHSQQMERLLADASATFASSLDYKETLTGVAGRIVPVLADVCVFDVNGRDGALQRVAWAYADGVEAGGRLQDIDRLIPPPGCTEHHVARAVETGQTELVADVTDAWLRSAALDGKHLEILRGLGARSVIIAPIAARDKVLGTVTLWYLDRSGRRYDDADRRVVEELARRAGLAVNNAALYLSAQDARADAEAASRMKDQFLATLSHELRTPLSAIVGWSRLLRSGKLDESDVEQGLDAIDRNAKIQTQLIEDLLDLSRIISGNLRLDIQRVSLPDVIDAALATTQPAAEAKGVRVVKIFDSLAGAVAGDPARLQQIIWNLLSNAVKFTPRGGRIQVLLERVNSHVEITVTDTGIGIMPEFLPFVFDRFRQADGTTTRRHGGLGLGLSIVKQLVEMHGGTVRAKSPGENQGSTFSVALPLLVVHEEKEGRRVQPKEPAAGELDFSDGLLEGVRVLVVDDEPDARELIRRVLAGSRAQVLIAGSAAEALDIIGSQAFNVLVSDIGLPDTDGYDLIREVRSRGYVAKNLPAVALTAFARSEDRRRALLAGFQVHVAKPVDPDELVAVVASLVGRTGRG